MDFLKELGIKDINPAACSRRGCMWGRDGNILSSINPTTGSVITDVRQASQDNYECVIQDAQNVFEKWRMVPAPTRGELVRLIGEKLREKKDALGSLVALEMGKIKAEGDGEVQEMIDMADKAVGLSRELDGKTMPSERSYHTMEELWLPLGVVGVISAFNFPVAVWSWNAFIAAACGNSVVWKPSSKTPLCAIAVQNICNVVMAQNPEYEGVFSMFISHDKELSERFVAEKPVRLVSFTGSIPTGRYVNEIVARDLGRRVLLELGGNNAIIVDETANLEFALQSVAFGAVGTAGQRCTTTRRVIIHEDKYDEFTRALVKAYSQVKIGDPLDPETLMGPLIDESAVRAFEDALSELKDIGAKILYGGNVLDGPGNFVEPTIVEASNDWDIVKRETFAPILYLMTYKGSGVSGLDNAIAIHNDVPQGLSSAIFTDKLQHAKRFCSAIGSDCGIVNVNIGTSGAEIGGAFGGEKETGGGREAGSDSWKQYMRRVTSTCYWGDELPQLAQGIKFKI